MTLKDPKPKFQGRVLRNVFDCVIFLRLLRFLRTFRFPAKRNARNRQPIGMVDLNSQSNACVVCGFRLRNARNAIGCVALS